MHYYLGFNKYRNIRTSVHSEYTPSSLRSNFSHAPQTNSDSKISHYIISWSKKCFGLVFSNNELFYSRERPSPMKISVRDIILRINDEYEVNFLLMTNLCLLKE